MEKIKSYYFKLSNIVYHQAGGATYARLALSYYEGNRVMKRTTNLGKVIDKENGTY